MPDETSSLRVLVYDAPDGPLTDLPSLFAGFGWETDYSAGWLWASLEGSPPDAVVVEASVPGGPRGPWFGKLVEEYLAAPVIVATRTRSLSQALGYFRAGATDYQPVPAAPADWQARVTESIFRRHRLVQGVAAVDAWPVHADPETDILAELARDETGSTGG